MTRTTRQDDVKKKTFKNIQQSRHLGKYEYAMTTRVQLD